MTATSPKAFLLSATFHAAIIALLFTFSFVINRQTEDIPPIFELVAGPGDNYGAKMAPALGEPGGLKVDIPAAPQPKPAPPQPIQQPEVAPITPAPTPTPKVVTPPPTPKTVTEQPIPDFKKKITQEMRKADKKAQRDLAKIHAEEKKRADEEKKKMTKAEFDRENAKQQKVASASSKSAPTKLEKINTEGIREGLIGGSRETKTGAGGKALTASEGSLADAYAAMVLDRLEKELKERSAGLDKGLRAEAEFHIMADGRLLRARITKSSRNDAFDAAVLAAIAAVRLPERPKGIDELQRVPFTTSGKDGD